MRLRWCRGDFCYGTNVSTTRAKPFAFGPTAESRTVTRSQSAFKLVTVGACPATHDVRLSEN